MSVLVSKRTICIAGKNDIAVDGLSYVRDNFPDFDICSIPNPSDTGVDSWQRSFKNFCEKAEIRQVSLEDLYDLESLVFLSLEYSELIDVRKFKSQNLFNIHFSLLPKYKGMFTSALPIMNGEEHSGVTLHCIDSGIDTGDIIDQVKFPIGPDDTARDLYFNYMKHGPSLIKDNFHKLVSGTYTARKQPAIGASYFSKKSIDYKNLKINYFKTAFEVRNQFRAFTFREYQLPTHGGWAIYQSEIMPERSSAKPGTQLDETASFFVVSTVDYKLKLLKDYYSFLWQSCEVGDEPGVEMSLERVPDINLCNAKGWNAIIIATYNGHMSIVRKLIAKGADINSRNYNGTTLLMYALTHFQTSRDARLFEFLLELGSKTDGKDRYGKTLRDHIHQKECTELLKLLD